MSPGFRAGPISDRKQGAIRKRRGAFPGKPGQFPGLGAGVVKNPNYGGGVPPSTDGAGGGSVLDPREWQGFGGAPPRMPATDGKLLPPRPHPIPGGPPGQDVRRFMNNVRGDTMYGNPLWGGPGMSGTAPAMADYFRTNPAEKRQAAGIFAGTQGQDVMSRFSGAGSVGNQILEALPGAKDAYLASLGHQLVDSNGDGTMDRVLPTGAAPESYSSSRIGNQMYNAADARVGSQGRVRRRRGPRVDGYAPVTLSDLAETPMGPGFGNSATPPGYGRRLRRRVGWNQNRWGQ